MEDNEFEELKRALPDVPDINGREEFFNSAVLVLMMKIDGEYNFIFEERSSNIRQGGEICFPGGRIDLKDKNSEAAAIRETYEELGITSDKIRIIGKMNTVMAPFGAIVEGFLAIADIKTLDEIKINKAEVESVFTVPVAYFKNNKPERYYTKVMSHSSYVDKNGENVELLPVGKLNLPTMYEKPWGNLKYSVYIYKFNGRNIWGLTARFVLDLVKRL